MTTTPSHDTLYATLQDSGLFAFFAANLEHLLHVTAPGEQLRIFREAQCFSHSQSGGVPTDVPDRDLPQDLLAMEKPGMIVAFHYGHYRLLPVQLAVRGIPICVLLAADAMQEQQTYYGRLFAGMPDVRLAFVAAEDPRLFYRLRHYRAQGYHILCYADGAKGLQDIHDARHTSCIGFLRARIYVRTGFAHIAHLLQSPIWAVWEDIGEQQEGHYHQRQYLPDAFADRKHFVDEVISDMFTGFARQVQKQPAAWEGLFYLKYILVLESLPEGSPVAGRLIPFRQGSRCFVLDKSTYRCYHITQDKFEKLLASFCTM